MPLPTYQVFAIKYASVSRQASDNFITNDIHDGPMPLDFFVWAIVGNGRTVVVDMGFDAKEAAKRGRELIRCPAEGLALVGVAAAQVKDVVVTHLHYDHAGNTDKFPSATFHLQDLEMSYATGRTMGHALQRHAYAVDYVTEMVRMVYGERVRFHDGEGQLAPGITLHHIGGHTRGLQVVRVHTARGWIVLASDASHFYANMEGPSPFPIVDSVSMMLEGYATLERLADSHAHIVPGHDPLVLARYPAPDKALQGIVACLHAHPST